MVLIRNFFLFIAKSRKHLARNQAKRNQREKTMVKVQKRQNDRAVLGVINPTVLREVGPNQMLAATAIPEVGKVVVHTRTVGNANPNSHDVKLTTVGERNAMMYERLKNCKNQKAIRTLIEDRAIEAARLIAAAEVEVEIDGIPNSKTNMYVERIAGEEMGTIRYRIDRNGGRQGSTFWSS